MFPEDRLSSTYISAPFLPYLRGEKLPFVDRCRAGVALNDASLGIDYQEWVGRLDGSVVTVTPQIGPTSTVHDFAAVVDNLTIAFDNNMQPACCVRAGPDYLFRWYDATVSSFTVMPLTGVRDAMIRIDEVRDSYTTLRDVIVSYVRNNVLCFRKTRDRYLIEYPLVAVHKYQRLYQCGMNEIGRFQWELVWDPALLPKGYHG